MVQHVSDIFITNWAALKADQAAVLLQLRDHLDRAVATANSLAVGTYQALIVRFLIKKKKLFRQLTALQIHTIANDLSFIHEPWHDFHVTYVKTRHGKLYAPAPRLISFTFWQLIKADAEYSKFLHEHHGNISGQARTLDRLIAILYQPKPGEFHEDTINDHADALPGALSIDLKYLILTTYSHCRQFIVSQRCPDLFSAGGSSAPGAPPVQTGKMWQSLLFDLSETPAFSGIENAKQAKAYDALDYLQKKASEAKNQK